RGCCFVQAEDGIRYWSVTGVQTCALPISELERRLDRVRCLARDGPLPHRPARLNAQARVDRLSWWEKRRHRTPEVRRAAQVRLRSEERRVGKEGEGRGARGQ